MDPTSRLLLDCGCLTETLDISAAPPDEAATILAHAVEITNPEGLL